MSEYIFVTNIFEYSNIFVTLCNRTTWNHLGSPDTTWHCPLANIIWYLRSFQSDLKAPSVEKLKWWRTNKISTYKYWSGSVLKNQIDKCEKTLSENIVNLNFQCLGLPSGWSCRKAWQNIFLANLPFPKTFSNSALVDWQNTSNVPSK